MTSEQSNLTMGEIDALISMIFNGKEPNDVCSYVLIAIKHPSHEMGIIDSGITDEQAAVMCIAAMRRCLQKGIEE